MMKMPSSAADDEPIMIKDADFAIFHSRWSAAITLMISPPIDIFIVVRY